jgi:hypothetical protein
MTPLGCAGRVGRRIWEAESQFGFPDDRKPLRRLCKPPASYLFRYTASGAIRARESAQASLARIVKSACSLTRSRPRTRRR